MFGNSSGPSRKTPKGSPGSSSPEADLPISLGLNVQKSSALIPQIKRVKIFDQNKPPLPLKKIKEVFPSKKKVKIQIDEMDPLDLVDSGNVEQSLTAESASISNSEAS